MNENTRRALLYGGAVVLLGGLGAVVMTYEAEADAMTLLSSADVQLRLAYGIPEFDKQGERLSNRDQMITEAIVLLDRVEKSTPGMAITSEFRGFAHMLQGEFGDAAVCYGRARDCEDCGDEQRDVLTFNQARMLREAGHGEAAVAVFERHKVELDSRFGAQRRIEQAATLRELDRRDEARALLGEVVEDSAVEPVAWVQAGIEYEELGDLQTAAQAFEQARERAPIADYYLARLKFRQDQTDTAIECLKRAVAAAPADTRRLVREEGDTWQALSSDVRFMELIQPASAAPMGR